MALKYVNSAAAGANDGTSWTDAWTSLASATGVAAGDEVRVHNAYSRVANAAITLSFTNGTRANPVRIICVDKDNSDALSTGAIDSCGNTGAYTIGGNVHVYGMTFKPNRSISFGNSSVSRQVFESCTVTNGASGSLGSETWALTDVEGQHNTFRQCTFDNSPNSNNGSAIVCIGSIAYGATAHLIGCTFVKGAANGAIAEILTESRAGARLIIEDSDLTTLATIFRWATNGNGVGIIRRCKLPTSYAVTRTGMNILASCLVEASAEGTITVPPLGMTQFDDYWGTAKSTLAKYRTGGADDGVQANAHAWELVSSANALTQLRPFYTPFITRWVAAGSQTLTVYLAGGASLNDDECWLEVHSPSEAGSADATGKFRTTRLALRGSAAALTTDGTSTWNGTGVGTKQKISVAIAPTVAGPISVRVALAKVSTTVYVDPRLEVA